MRNTSDLKPLGHAKVYRSASGQIVVDTDTIRRTRFAGEDFGDDVGDDVEGDDVDGDDDDDFGDDDLGDDVEGDDVEGDDFGDDDLGDDVEGDDDVGAMSARRRRRRARRAARLERKARRLRGTKRKKKMRRWGKTVVAGSSTLGAAGNATISIRLQHDFKAEDVTFTGSLANSLVTSIRFGDRLVWDNASGVDVSVFASTGFLRGLLKGQKLRAGLDIILTGILPGAGTLAATLVGEKPVEVC